MDSEMMPMYSGTVHDISFYQPQDAELPFYVHQPLYGQMPMLDQKPIYSQMPLYMDDPFYSDQAYTPFSVAPDQFLTPSAFTPATCKIGCSNGMGCPLMLENLNVFPNIQMNDQWQYPYIHNMQIAESYDFQTQESYNSKMDMNPSILDLNKSNSIFIPQMTEMIDSNQKETSLYNNHLEDKYSIPEIKLEGDGSDKINPMGSPVYPAMPLIMPVLNSTLIVDLEDEDTDIADEELRKKKNTAIDILRKIESSNPALIKSLMAYNIPYPVARRLVQRIIQLTLSYR